MILSKTKKKPADLPNDHHSWPQLFIYSFISTITTFIHKKSHPKLYTQNYRSNKKMLNILNAIMYVCFVRIGLNFVFFQETCFFTYNSTNARISSLGTRDLKWMGKGQNTYMSQRSTPFFLSILYLSLIVLVWKREEREEQRETFERSVYSVFLSIRVLG